MTVVVLQDGQRDRMSFRGVSVEDTLATLMLNGWWCCLHKSNGEVQLRFRNKSLMQERERCLGT